MSHQFRDVVFAVLAVAVSLPACTSKSTPTAPTANCTYTISSTTVSADAAGGALSVTVTTSSTCVWTALTNSSFIAMTSAAGQTGNGTATFTVAQNTGAARSGTFTIGGQTITVNQSAGTTTVTPPSVDAIFGNWAGTITMNVGCVAGLPQNFAWTGVIRQAGSTGTEFVISIPSVGVNNQVFPITLNGSGLLFNVQVDSVYTFTGTIATDRRSVTGTFIGTNCRTTGTPVLPSGTWSGSRQ